MTPSSPAAPAYVPFDGEGAGGKRGNGNTCPQQPHYLDTTHNINSWFSANLWPLLCSMALSLSHVNLARFPAEAVRLGGAPYLLAHAALTLLLAPSLTQLELALGQFTGQGAAAVWRGIPALRGVAYLKLAGSFACACWSIVYVAMSAGYLVRVAAGTLPMSECTQLTMTEHGYFQNNTLGMECAKRTFLKPFNEDPFWYPMMCIVFFVCWILVPLCLYDLDKGLKCSLSCLASIVFLLCVGLCGANSQNNLTEIFEGADWSALGTSRLWFAALAQVLLSNRAGLALLDTVGGTVYFHSNIVVWSVVLVVCNLTFGWLGLMVWVSLSGGVARDTSVLSVLLWVYDAAVVQERTSAWPCVAYAIVLCSAIITVVSLLYPVFSSLSVTFKHHWRFPALVLISLGMATTMALFVPVLDLITILDRFVLPLFLAFIVVVEIIAFLVIYGWRKILVDFEFMLGKRMSKTWVLYWLAAAAAIVATSAARLSGVLSGGWADADGSLFPLWLLVAIMSLALLTIVVWAVIIILHQDEYDLFLNIKSSFKPSRKWGPVDPILRHFWIQWTENPNNLDILSQMKLHQSGASIVQDSSTESRKSSLEPRKSL